MASKSTVVRGSRLKSLGSVDDEQQKKLQNNHPYEPTQYQKDRRRMRQARSRRHTVSSNHVAEAESNCINLIEDDKIDSQPQEISSSRTARRRSVPSNIVISDSPVVNQAPKFKSKNLNNNDTNNSNTNNLNNTNNNTNTNNTNNTNNNNNNNSNNNSNNSNDSNNSSNSNTKNLHNIDEDEDNDVDRGDFQTSMHGAALQAFTLLEETQKADETTMQITREQQQKLQVQQIKKKQQQLPQQQQRQRQEQTPPPRRSARIIKKATEKVQEVIEHEEINDDYPDLDNGSSINISYDGPRHLIFVYPPGERGSVRVTAEERGRLQDRCYLNDSLIDFYIKFIEMKNQQCNSLIKQQRIFFSSFFFGRLTQQSLANNTNIANATNTNTNTTINNIDSLSDLIDYHGVKSWTKNIDLFEQKFIFIPICESSHWSLIIIVNLNYLERAIYQADNSNPLPKMDVPRVFYLDSLDPDRGNAFGQKICLYLAEEYFERKEKNKTIEKKRQLLSSFTKLIKIKKPTIPIQSNEYDCGLYLLYCLELFLENRKNFADHLVNGENTKLSEAFNHTEIEKMRKMIVLLMNSMEQEAKIKDGKLSLKKKNGKKKKKKKRSRKQTNGDTQSQQEKGQSLENNATDDAECKNLERGKASSSNDVESISFVETQDKNQVESQDAMELTSQEETIGQSSKQKKDPAKLTDMDVDTNKYNDPQLIPEATKKSIMNNKSTQTVGDMVDVSALQSDTVLESDIRRKNELHEDMTKPIVDSKLRKKKRTSRVSNEQTAFDKNHEGSNSGTQRNTSTSKLQESQDVNSDLGLVEKKGNNQHLIDKNPTVRRKLKMSENSSDSEELEFHDADPNMTIFGYKEGTEQTNTRPADDQRERPGNPKRSVQPTAPEISRMQDSKDKRTGQEIQTQETAKQKENRILNITNGEISRNPTAKIKSRQMLRKDKDKDIVLETVRKSVTHAGEINSESNYTERTEREHNPTNNVHHELNSKDDLIHQNNNSEIIEIDDNDDDVIEVEDTEESVMKHKKVELEEGVMREEKALAAEEAEKAAQVAASLHDRETHTHGEMHDDEMTPANEVPEDEVPMTTDGSFDDDENMHEANFNQTLHRGITKDMVINVQITTPVVEKQSEQLDPEDRNDLENMDRQENEENAAEVNGNEIEHVVDNIPHLERLGDMTRKSNFQLKTVAEFGRFLEARGKNVSNELQSDAKCVVPDEGTGAETNYNADNGAHEEEVEIQYTQNSNEEYTEFTNQDDNGDEMNIEAILDSSTPLPTPELRNEVDDDD